MLNVNKTAKKEAPPEKLWPYRLLDIPLFKFGLAGVVNTLVDFSVYWLFVFALVHPQEELVAKTIGAIAGISSAFVLNSFWVFRQNFMPGLGKRSGLRRKASYIGVSFGKMFLTYSFGMVLNVLVFTLLRERGLWELASLLGATAASMVFNYFFSKKFVFTASS